MKRNERAERSAKTNDNTKPFNNKLTMKKISLAILFMLVASVGAMAKSVVFTLSDGTLVYYLLGGETNPIMRFVDGKIVVNADEYELTGIKNFYISATDDPNGIEQTAAEKNFSFKENRFVVKASAENVAVYSVSGAKVDAAVESAEGFVTIDLSSADKGTYVIKVGNSSVKVMKK